MGEVLPFGNRVRRRARHAQRRREDRHAHTHATRCPLAIDANKGGVSNVRITPELYHDVHRVLGEPSCPLCPRCVALKREGKIDHVQPRRLQTLAAWARLLSRTRAEQKDGA